MGFSITQSLTSSQPPLIVFTLCLTVFGFTMVVLAYVVGEKEIPNPDIKMDWNKYFKKISKLKVCPYKNFTRNSEGAIISENILGSIPNLNASSSHVVDESKSMSAVLSGVVDLAMEDNWKESMFVEVSVSSKFRVQGKLPFDSSVNLKGQIKGNNLGFSGKYGRLLYNVSLNFHPLNDVNCTNNKCLSTYEVCITMSWPSELLPKTKDPKRCNVNEAVTLLPVIFSELSLPEVESSKTCIELNYTSDSKLTEMLSLHDRSIVNLHLMHTSYFMFVMVMTLMCYSLIKGRSRHPKNYVSLQKVLDT